MSVATTQCGIVPRLASDSRYHNYNSTRGTLGMRSQRLRFAPELVTLLLHRRAALLPDQHHAADQRAEPNSGTHPPWAIFIMLADEIQWQPMVITITAARGHLKILRIAIDRRTVVDGMVADTAIP